MTFLPGDHEDDIHYVLAGHAHVLTDLEWRAWRNISVQCKIENAGNERMATIMRERWLDTSDDVQKLLADGKDAFYQRVLERVLAERPDGLNRCPECGSLCRTHKA